MAMASTSTTNKALTSESDVRASTQDLENDIKLLKSDIAKLAKQLAATGEHSIGTARRAASEGADRLRVEGEAAIDQIRTNARDLEQQVTASVREKPITALAMAAGVGFLFALIARR
ncbi:DUF883 family protein [Mesorhizobium sp. NBSH29]|uniref:DUF883 family protein n=1 Tax=Mesorhizobium sp. NBSH29 TaxID=2654249 RepID=UPI00189657E4|nr:DUF883 family protein [Mesorhizobium sp. NBSH29]QPC85715.1 DUF883 family protein [Mesorhizobium sp. NBSH29]